MIKEETVFLTSNLNRPSQWASFITSHPAPSNHATRTGQRPPRGSSSNNTTARKQNITAATTADVAAPPFNGSLDRCSASTRCIEQHAGTPLMRQPDRGLSKSPLTPLHLPRATDTTRPASFVVASARRTSASLSASAFRRVSSRCESHCARRSHRTGIRRHGRA